MVKVNIDLKGVKKKFGAENVNRGRYALANQALADMNKFVPKDQTPLRLTGNVSGDGKEVTWNTPYAKAQFYGRVGKGGYPVINYTTPGTGPRWDEKAKGIHMKAWKNAFVKGAGF